MTARERIDALLDPKSPRIEIGAFAADGMYKEHGGAPCAGVVVVIGYVSKRQCIVVANDATVKAGAWFPMTGKKNLRAQEIAIENRLPIIYLVDSAGVYLPMQDEIFPDKEHFGRIFRNNAVMSSMGITQISAIMGSCVAGGAYLPIMSDEALIVEKTGSIFLAGSYLVKAAIGEDIDNETLGGATTHSEISGVTDYKCKDDADCLKKIRAIVDKLGKPKDAGFSREKSQRTEGRPEGDLRPHPHRARQALRHARGDRTTGGRQRVHRIQGRLRPEHHHRLRPHRRLGRGHRGQPAQGGEEQEGRDAVRRRHLQRQRRQGHALHRQLQPEEHPAGLPAGRHRLHGGQPQRARRHHQGRRETGERRGNSVVPKFTIIIGNSYGAGNYAMCGKAYDPRLIVGWPSAQVAVMGGEQASKVMLQIEVAALKGKGETITPEKEAELLNRIRSKYEETISPYYAASRLWLDAVIDPLETRTWISLGIEAASQSPATREFNMGVLQTKRLIQVMRLYLRRRSIRSKRTRKRRV
jgi:3-methylcrotonyl-CoA carboxylase beta subunit